jgi:hypothetical protein
MTKADRLLDYVQHKPGCGKSIARTRFGDADKGDCTCGLSTLLAEAEERAHYAHGVAELAMKHRDEAEAEHQRLREESDMDYIAAALHCSPTRDAIGAAIQELYRRFDAEAERPTPPVEDDGYLVEFTDTSALDGFLSPVEAPQEDAVTRAKLEMLDEVGRAWNNWREHLRVGAFSHGDGRKFTMHLDALRAHLKGSPDAE